VRAREIPKKENDGRNPSEKGRKEKEGGVMLDLSPQPAPSQIDLFDARQLSPTSI